MKLVGGKYKDEEKKRDCVCLLASQFGWRFFFVKTAK